jgi:2-polyprenyl-3-methyl-5-hydroxy-6-metoxy-1,4-benzoquinol methylase
MMLLDRILRDWRIKVAMRHMPQETSHVLDIGCYDGHLLNQIPRIPFRAGIDPRLKESRVLNGAKVVKGSFPKDRQILDGGPYDVIFALAVFEHFSQEDIEQAARIIPSMLAPNGRLIITVPHPLVDGILRVLIFLRLIKGQATEEHHGFDPKEIVEHFGCTLDLMMHKTFQLGLNNIFVFERSQ